MKDFRIKEKGTSHSLTEMEIVDLRSDYGLDMDKYEVLSCLTKVEWELIGCFRKTLVRPSIRAGCRELSELFTSALEEFGERIFAQGCLAGKNFREE